ncbi:hypothetical protein OE88DRAFT_1730986 [Heliocybe sulcata]|uniref:SH3 domain-containing protein n=1 Tax=Heliocybe sulcata TaxID=5364 RepID=A0A5C3NJT6_9AGAM|nr:hypothetical protein OE88DRAFT_1730986 [Heliocybe sulcata]
MAPIAKPSAPSRHSSLDLYVVERTYAATAPSHISLNINEEVYVLDYKDPGLWKGRVPASGNEASSLASYKDP